MHVNYQYSVQVITYFFLLCAKHTIFCLLFVKKARVGEVISWAWDVFQPLLFGLIGAEIRVNELEGLTVGEMDAQSLQNNSVIIVKNSNVTV